MTTNLSIDSASAAELIGIGDFEIIGTAGGRQYARHKDGRELLIGGILEPWERDNPVKPSEVRIEKRERVQDRMMPFPELLTMTIRATVVPAGSYEQAKQREQAMEADKQRRANPGYRAVDALAHLALMRHRPAEIEALEPASADNFLLSGRAILTRGQDAARGPEDIVARLASKGVTLRLDASGHYLIAWSKEGRLKPEVRELLRESEPLLRAFLAGQPLICALDHPKDKAPAAVTLIEPSGMPVCEQHATEELRP